MRKLMGLFLMVSINSQAENLETLFIANRVVRIYHCPDSSTQSMRTIYLIRDGDGILWWTTYRDGQLDKLVSFTRAWGCEGQWDL